MTEPVLDLHPDRDTLVRLITPAGAHDETRNTDGEIRPAWKRLLGALQDDPDRLERRWEQSRQLIRENGIVFGAYLGGERQARPWQLDPLPVLLESAEWRNIEAALEQRARLLELILTDLLGPQRLLHERVLPPEALFLNPGHWRPLHGHSPLGGVRINFYSADMARANDGSWRILADRCEAPSGLGFALENRGVISRAFPGEFRECYVKRLAPFFRSLQASMQALAPQRENPRVSILSEGPSSENYFEDAYLARHLGYTLVMGGDLAVRGQQVFLKTLGGLLPIDVLMRRSETAYCDPLELAGNSRGVTGLVQAARSRNVAICNALGSGLVESPIMMAFMPEMCQFLLGEPLKMCGIKTWWCGDPATKSYVLDNLDRLVVTNAFRDRSNEQQVAQELQRLSTTELAARIETTPERFVAQERVERSVVPNWAEGYLQPAHLALRSYVVAANGGYEVLAGGLARTAKDLDSLEVSLHSGDGSKDVWIVGNADEPLPIHPPLVAGPVELRRSGADLPSRVAENVFWLGRYLERSESAIRLLRALTFRLTGETDYRALPDLPLLLRAMASQGQIEAGFVVEGIKEQLPAIDQVLPWFVLDRREAGSVRSILETTLTIAARVRDRLSVDSWRILLDMQEQFRRPPQPIDLTTLGNLTNQLILDLSAFSGMVTESVTRTQAYRFLVIGRRLERALQIISLAENCFLGVSAIPSELLESILEIADSLMTYRSRYLANLQLSAVLDLILTDETNPRSLAYQLLELKNLVEELPQRNVPLNREQDKKITMAMIHEIRMVDIEEISQLRASGDDDALQSLLHVISRNLPKLSNVITHRYFVHAEASHQLTDVMISSDRSSKESS